MKFKIIRSEGFCSLRLTIAPNEIIKAESDALVLRDETIEVAASIDGGIVSGMMRRLGKESIFMQHISTRDGQSGNVLLSPKKIGDVFPLELTQNHGRYYLHKDGFLAAEKNVEVHTHTQSVIKSIFSKEGMFILEITGQGLVWVEGFGRIFEYNLGEGEQVIVNNEHLVAWESHMDYQIIKSGKGILSSVLSGGGLACKVKGPGKLLVQSHSRNKYIDWIITNMKFPKGKSQDTR